MEKKDFKNWFKPQPKEHTRSELTANWLKDFVKNLKRVKWAKGKELRKTFFWTGVFIVVISLILFGIAMGLSSMWQALGVGV